MVERMSEQPPDPAGNTEQFRAFVHAPEPERDPAAGVKRIAIIGAVIVVLAALALIAFIALR
jgi:hypothetical protein